MGDRQTDTQTHRQRLRDKKSEREGGRKGVRLTDRRRQTEGQIKLKRRHVRR